MIDVKTVWGKVLFSYDENEVTLKEEIAKHKDLRRADLYRADLSGADLRGADLRRANLRYADLRRADLSGADLRRADLNGADLRGVDLSYAHFKRTNLNGADLRYADLSGADLSKASIRYADLSTAKNVPEGLPMACPEDGSFIAWKKVSNYCLVKLEIPYDAKRCSATSKKCRCDKAKVLEITNIFTGGKIDEVVNVNYALCKYKVGEMVYSDDFDENRWNECSHGIHFFIDRDDAVNY